MNRFLFTFLILLAFFILPSKTLAASITITNYPSSAQIESEFTVQFNAEGLTQGTYYGKVRIGKAGEIPNKAETKNGDSWLGDSGVSWPEFPAFTVDESGSITGILIARAKSTADIGENSLYVRLNNENNLDSSAVKINLEQAPTSVPTQVPTSSPTNSPTSTKAPTPTKIPTKAPTSTPTSKPTPTPKEKDEAVSVVLGESEESKPTPEPTETPKVSSQIPNNAILFVILGLIILTVCGILAYFQFGDKILPWKKKSL